MDLQTFWFAVIAVLWAGYFMLEGFDFGIGILMPFVATNEQERRGILTTLGPLWDGNEVWVLTAGGATFAAFPEWYATMFSGFYLPLLLILVALIIRGVAFEYRSKRSSMTWRKRWDACIFIGSLLPAILWGVAFANLIRGLEMEKLADGGTLYTGGFFALLNPYALVGGLTTLALFLTHGSIFLALKTEGTLHTRSSALTYALGTAAAVLAVVFLVWTQLAYSTKAWTWILLVVAVVSWVMALVMHRAKREGWSFVFSSLAIVVATEYLFCVLFPNVMTGNDPGTSLTVYNASSSQYTLGVMTIIALCFVPIVLAYQIWTYWVFRKRLTADSITDADVGSLDLPHEVEAQVSSS